MHTAHCSFCLKGYLQSLVKQISKELFPTLTPKTTQSYVYITGSYNSSLYTNHIAKAVVITPLCKISDIPHAQFRTHKIATFPHHPFQRCRLQQLLMFCLVSAVGCITFAQSLIRVSLFSFTHLNTAHKKRAFFRKCPLFIFPTA